MNTIAVMIFNHVALFDIYNHYHIMLGSGVSPISDPVQVPQSFDLVYPMSKLSSKHNDKFKETVLPAEYEDFLQLHEKNALIVFGTTHMPSVSDMAKLLEVIQDPTLADIGFIIGLKTIESIPTARNIMVREFVPQKMLLNDPRIKMFVTHCGANSVHEAFYYNGTPLFGLP
mmetsp:Transcript_30246/g.41013  ORF Transcript_30246/g.41013 Transcript_30246/m.41013 type:complete len:172 (-) Transcript_30246:365-880(-)